MDWYIEICLKNNTILQTKPEKDTHDLEIKLLDENNFSNKFNPEMISNITIKDEEQQQ